MAQVAVCLAQVSGLYGAGSGTSRTNNAFLALFRVIRPARVGPITHFCGKNALYVTCRA